VRTFAPFLILAMAGLLSACGGTASVPRASYIPGHAVDCVPFARALTGVALSGDAPDWWAEAESRYRRTRTPQTGSILAFRPSPRLPHGHVSVVSEVLSDRSILVTQANWVHGRVTEDEPVLDISPGNDWTEVRVWWQPSGALGVTAYPTFGFIVPSRRLDHDTIVAEAPRAAIIAYHPRE